jgi:4-diphosphocytidyl-2-C-methyl-D-erythritol kinase
MAAGKPAAAPIVVRPGAKINLSLEVLGRRPDGYHELATVFQAIDLTDELAISPADAVCLTCDRAGLPDTIDLDGEGNLAHRAASLLREVARVTAGAQIRLRKGVPIAAGLGGGSADAAGALVGCARLWGLDWPTERLVDLAARLGSDCAFFVGALHSSLHQRAHPPLPTTPPYAGGVEWERRPSFSPLSPGGTGAGGDGCATALAEGRGEQLTTLASLAPHHVVIVRPRLRHAPPADKTRRLYAALNAADYRDGKATRALVESISTGRPLDPDLLVNSFERAAEAVVPEIAAARAALLAAGADWVRLAGSGPCIYTLFAEPNGARTAAVLAALRAAGEEAYLARTGIPRA